MASILHTAAQQVNADTAGRTTHPGEEVPGAPAAPTPGEILHSVVTTTNGALDSLFRQEPIAVPITSAAAAVPSTATRGPHGGLVPSRLKNIVSGAAAPSPGPGPTLGPTTEYGGHPFVPAATVVADTKNGVATAWSALRRALGV